MILCSLFYRIRISVFKIDMLTCRSVHAFHMNLLCDPLRKTIRICYISGFFPLFCSSYFAYAFIFFFCFFLQQHTGGRKQMAKAITAVNKTSKSSSSFKKRAPSAAVPTPPPKRRSYQPDRVVTCYNCQQTGHIAPRCPSRPPSSSTPAPKTAPKK